MSKLRDDIKKYVQGDYLTGEEYGKWGCLNRVQRKDINKLCELCDMFEKSADNFYKENLQKDQRIAELEKQLAIRDRALEIQTKRAGRLNELLDKLNHTYNERFPYNDPASINYHMEVVIKQAEKEIKADERKKVCENSTLKSIQNKFAIEKLEELKHRYYETIDDCGQLNYECELNDYGMFIKLNRMIKELKGEK